MEGECLYFVSCGCMLCSACYKSSRKECNACESAIIHCFNLLKDSDFKIVEQQFNGIPKLIKQITSACTFSEKQHHILSKFLKKQKKQKQEKIKMMKKEEKKQRQMIQHKKGMQRKYHSNRVSNRGEQHARRKFKTKSEFSDQISVQSYQPSESNLGFKKSDRSHRSRKSTSRSKQSYLSDASSKVSNLRLGKASRSVSSTSNS